MRFRVIEGSYNNHAFVTTIDERRTRTVVQSCDILNMSKNTNELNLKNINCEGKYTVTIETEGGQKSVFRDCKIDSMNFGASVDYVGSLGFSFPIDSELRGRSNVAILDDYSFFDKKDVTFTVNEKDGLNLNRQWTYTNKKTGESVVSNHIDSRYWSDDWICS